MKYIQIIGYALLISIAILAYRVGIVWLAGFDIERGEALAKAVDSAVWITLTAFLVVYAMYIMKPKADLLSLREYLEGKIDVLDRSVGRRFSEQGKRIDTVEDSTVDRATADEIKLLQKQLNKLLAAELDAKASRRNSTE